jgi:hypothetical protein
MDEALPNERRGWLKHGNPVGDYLKSPRCGAMNRRGTACQCPAMRNKHGVYTRCRLHGGLSRGPKTQEGRQRARTARLKHGTYSAGTVALRRQCREMLRKTKELLRDHSRRVK